MRSRLRERKCATYALLAAAVVATFVGPVAGAQEGPFPSSLTLLPESDSATSGTCNEFTARATSFGEGPNGGPPVQGATVDVVQMLGSAGTEPGETRELAFCDPQNPTGPNPTGQGNTSFGDVSGNNPTETAGAAGRNTTVHAEVGPTDANGEVTFGITMSPPAAAGTVTVTAWFDFGDDDQIGEGDPSDSSTKTWVAAEQPPVTSLDASPETATNPNGTQHTVSVTVLADGQPVSGVVPSSEVEADGSGRPPGDVADPAAGASPNSVPGKGKPSFYACTATNAQGVSTCTFQDPAATGAGTDTLVFFVDLGGVVGDPDAGDPQDAVQKTWFVPAPPPDPGPSTPEPRNVRLCHGSTVAPVCDTAPRLREAGDEHEVAALVTDRQGSPLANVPVELRETGPATFTLGGAGSVLATTGADGIARAVLTSAGPGTSSIVAEISPPGTTGSLRGPGAADDECEQPAGAGGAPPVGNCVSQALSVTWEVPPPTECGDGVDNDDDLLVDLEDPGCTDGTDDSETPDPHPEPVRHPRRISMRFRDWVGPVDEGLVIFGRLRLDDDPEPFHKCVVGQTVEIQRLIDGEWVTRKTATTNSTGRYAGVVLDFTGRYRAVALRSSTTDETGLFHMCAKAVKAKTHHHRR